MMERVLVRNMGHTLSFEAARTHIDSALAAAGFSAGAVAEADALSARSGGAAHVDQWLKLMIEWNARIDLTAARTEGELCDLMLADALALASRIPQGASVVDVGSGAGAPGLPLAFVRPDLRVTLVEPLAKRISFLRTVIGTVSRADVRLERARGEQVAGEWDVAISRATLPPPAWLALGATRITRNGSVWVLLAKEDAPAHPEMHVVEEMEYAWPATGVTRRAVRYAFTAP